MVLDKRTKGEYLLSCWATQLQMLINQGDAILLLIVLQAKVFTSYCGKVWGGYGGSA